MKKLVFLLILLFEMLFTLFAQGRPVVVIVPFDAKGVNQDEVDVISEVFLSEYTSTGKATVVDRNNFDKIAAQQKFQLSDWSDSNKVAELGSALNAHQIITGQISQFGSQFVCTIKCIDVNTTEVVSSTVKRVATMDALFDTCTALIRDIATKASMSVKEYRIGDKGPAGGIIFAIEGDNRWEVSENLGEYNWRDAFDLYELNGYYDWILPTIDELTSIYNLSQKGFISQSGEFWSRTLKENDRVAYVYKSLSFSSGSKSSYQWEKKLNVRLIRKFDINKNIKVMPPESPVGEYEASIPVRDVIKNNIGVSGSNKLIQYRDKIIENCKEINQNLSFKLVIKEDGTYIVTYEILQIREEHSFSKSELKKFTWYGSEIKTISVSRNWKMHRDSNMEMKPSFQCSDLSGLGWYNTIWSQTRDAYSNLNGFDCDFSKMECLWYNHIGYGCPLSVVLIKK